MKKRVKPAFDYLGLGFGGSEQAITKGIPYSLGSNSIHEKQEMPHVGNIRVQKL